MVHHTIIALRKKVEDLETELAQARQEIESRTELQSEVEGMLIEIETLRAENARLKRQVFALNSKGPRIKALVG